MGNASLRKSQGSTDRESDLVMRNLEILADPNTTEEERKIAFSHLRQKLIPKRKEEEYATEVTRVFSLRFPEWSPPPPSLTAFHHEDAIAIRLSDAVRGCLYGAALGDAMGLATEFLSKETISSYYGAEYDFRPGCEVYPDIHRLSFGPGDWTDDTDHLILTLQSLLETKGSVDPVNFATKLVHWVDHGFAELGDEGGAGLGQTTKRVIRSSDYTSDPVHVAEQVWIQGGRKAAPNGALMRTAVVGIVSFWDLDLVIANAISLCKTTHADPRCVATCVAVSCCIALILQSISSSSHDDNHYKKECKIDIDEIVKESIQRAFTNTNCSKEEKEEFGKMAAVDDIMDLDLDSPEGMGYTYRCAACCFVMTKKHTQLSFLDAINDIIRNGGDADTNATVAGAVIGCLHGYSNLPLEAISAMPNVSWFEAWVQKLLFMLRLTCNLKTEPHIHLLEPCVE